MSFPSILFFGCLGVQAVDLTNIQLGGVYSVGCVTIGTEDCLYDHLGYQVPDTRTAALLKAGGGPDNVLGINIAHGEWCQFEQVRHSHANGFMHSNYVGVPGHPAAGAVYGDPLIGSQNEPSYAVLIIGKSVVVEDNLNENCGQILRLRKQKSTDRFQYVVIAATKVDDKDAVDPDDVVLMVSPRVMSTACCQFSGCLVDGSTDQVPKIDDCFATGTLFDLEAMPDGGGVKFGQGNQTLGIFQSDGVPCPGYVPDAGTLLAQAVQLDGSYLSFVAVNSPGMSALSACQTVFDVFNEADETKTIQVVVGSYKDLNIPLNSDGSFFLRIAMANCEKLCPGQCDGGRMGSPPPHCHLTYRVAESSPSYSPPDGYMESVIRPWEDLASCGEYSCITGSLDIPTVCGTRDQPCYAAMKWAEETICGAVHEVLGENGGQLYIQVIHYNHAIKLYDFLVSPHGFPKLCPNACSASATSVPKCRGTCLEWEIEQTEACTCVGCLGGGRGDHEVICRESNNCKECGGDCVMLPGPEKAAQVIGYARYDFWQELPLTTSTALAPACAAAAASMLIA